MPIFDRPMLDVKEGAHGKDKNIKRSQEQVCGEGV